MKKIIGTLALVAIGVALLLAPTPAGAVCGSSVVFGQEGLNCGGTYCDVVSPGLNTNASIQATFWSLNAGSPTGGVGNDNGGFADDGWLISFGGPNLALTGDWSVAGGIDGCATTAAMVIAFSANNAVGDSFFAVVCNTRNPLVTTQFNQAQLVPPGDIVLKPLPAANVTGSVRVGTEASITVGSPSVASIFYSDGSAGCAINTVIPQYDVWVKQIARSGPAPTDHSQDTGLWTLGGTCNVGSSCTVQSTCGATNCDGFVAVSPHYNSNFSTGDAPGKDRIAANSVRFQAGTTLADPPKIKRIPQGPKRLNN
jgi:hypothetical protein